MSVRKNLIGQKFERLTVISFAGIGAGSQSTWECLCDCGNVVIISVSKFGKTKSCGCLKMELISILNRTHGESSNGKKTKEFNTWHCMINRCYNQNNHSYVNYGARGITVCERWLNSYEDFLSDMGRAPSKKHMIERVKNDKGYSPENCIWAVNKVQANNRRNNHRLTLNGEELTLAQWREKLGISLWKFNYLFYNRKMNLQQIVDVLN